MPEVVQLGPFLIKMSMLGAVVSLLAAFAAVRLRLRNDPAQRKAILDTMSGSLLLAFLVWKFSYVLFHPAQALAQPVSLLYFSGGGRGVWLALLAVAAYLSVQIRRRHIPVPVFANAIAAGGLSFWGVGHALTWGMERLDGWYYGQQTAIAAVFWLWLNRRKDDRAAGMAFWLELLLWFGISQVYVSFFSRTHTPYWAGLSKEQLLYYLFSVLALILSHRVRDPGGNME